MKYFKKFEIYLSVKIKFMQTNLVRPDHKKMVKHTQKIRRQEQMNCFCVWPFFVADFNFILPEISVKQY